MTVFRWIHLTTRNFSTKFVWKIIRLISLPITSPHPPPKSCSLWDNVEKYGRIRLHDNIIRRMRSACWITKVTNTHSEYVIYNCFSAVKMVAGTRVILTLYVHCLWLWRISLAAVRCVCVCDLQVGKTVLNPFRKQKYRSADKSLARPDWKNNWKVAISRPTRRSLLPRRPGSTDNLLNCFWVACKSQSLVAVACFLPGRAKDLTAPRYVVLMLNGLI